MRFSQETAIVSYIKGDYAFLKTDSASGCGSCASKGGCGSVSLFSLTPKVNLKVSNTLALKEGDSVIVAMPSDTLLLGTFLIYVLPLFALFIGAVMGKILAGETMSILAGLVGLFAGLLFVKRFIAQSHVAQQFEPKLLKKLIHIEASV